MDSKIVYEACSIFLSMLEYMYFFYFLLSWIPRASKLRELIYGLLEPLFSPIRYLLKHSIFNTPRADLAPLISFVIIIFLKEFINQLRIG